MFVPSYSCFTIMWRGTAGRSISIAFSCRASTLIHGLPVQWSFSICRFGFGSSHRGCTMSSRSIDVYATTNFFGKENRSPREVCDLDLEGSSQEGVYRPPGNHLLVLLQPVAKGLYQRKPRGWREYRDRCFVHGCEFMGHALQQGECLLLLKPYAIESSRTPFLRWDMIFGRDVSIVTEWECIFAVFRSVAKIPGIFQSMYDVPSKGPPKCSLQYRTIGMPEGLAYIPVRI